MKNLIFIGAIALSLNVFANDVDTAIELFEIRGENVNNALEASKIYGTLAASEEDQEEKGILLNGQAEALYYVGSQAKEDSDKVPVFKKSYEIAEQAIKTLLAAEGDEEALASAYFWHAAGLGKYGEAKGIASSIGKLPELKASSRAILNMGGMEYVQEYGAHRILGRMYFKVPKLLGGSKKKALAFAKEAFENTLSDDGKVSVHGLNNLYYADTLKKNNKAEACRVLKDFSEQDSETLLDTRIPETAKEIKEAIAMMKDFKC